MICLWSVRLITRRCCLSIWQKLAGSDVNLGLVSDQADRSLSSSFIVLQGVVERPNENLTGGFVLQANWRITSLVGVSN